MTTSTSPTSGKCFSSNANRSIKNAERSLDTALGVTSRTPEQASPQRVLEINRGHWTIESVHYIIDWNYDEDRSRIRTGFGPENITRLRRFAVGVLKSFQKPRQSIATMMRHLAFNRRHSDRFPPGTRKLINRISVMGITNRPSAEPGGAAFCTGEVFR
jgi:hypothetical protein